MNPGARVGTQIAPFDAKSRYVCRERDPVIKRRRREREREGNLLVPCNYISHTKYPFLPPSADRTGSKHVIQTIDQITPNPHGGGPCVFNMSKTPITFHGGNLLMLLQGLAMQWC